MLHLRQCDDSAKGSRSPSKGTTKVEKPEKRMPLSVLPKGAIYSFPFVLGLDSYEYEFGRNVALRATGRYQLATAEPQGSKPSKRKKESAARLVQAGAQGSTAILWRQVAHSSDSGALKVRKRRQKLTDDLLHDLVVTHEDPIELVHQWFRIFQHFSDAPDEIVLPSLPERREDVSPPSPPSCVVSTASRISTKSTRRSKGCVALSRPCSAPSLKRPEIVRVLRRQCKDAILEEERCELQKTRNVLKEAGLAGVGAGQLDLAHRLKAQNLNDESFTAWLESFKFIWNLQQNFNSEPQSGQTVKTSAASGQTETVPRRLSARNVRDVTSRYMKKLNKRVFDMGVWDVFAEEGNVSSATSSETGTTEDEAEYPTSLKDLNLNQVMLRSSSLAMMKSKILWNKAKEEGINRSKSAFEEIARARVEILNSVAPTQMTFKNFSSFLAIFGVRRRETVERVAKHLFLSVPCASRKRVLETEHEDEKEEAWQLLTTLPFEVFYRFVKALNPEPSQGSFRHVSSELLCRIVFCAVTGYEGVSHDAGAALRFKDDASQKPLTKESVFQSVRNFFEEKGAGEQEKLEQDVQGVAEFVFAALARSEASLRTSVKSGISFNGFQSFVRQNQEVYIQLLFLLLPLATTGEKFAAEEMHLMQKGLYHRAGELREKAATMARELQKRHLAHLLAEFVQPWREVCRRNSRSGNVTRKSQSAA